MDDIKKKIIINFLNKSGITSIFQTRKLKDNLEKNYIEKIGFFKKIRSAYYKNIVRYNFDKTALIRNITYIHGDARLKLKLNINEYTQCQYYFYIDNPYLKNLIIGGGEVFIDIGANIGAFSLMAGHYFKRVIAFEPDPTTLQIFKTNLELNYSDEANIHIYDNALSDNTRDEIIYENLLNLGGTKIGQFSEEYKKNIGYENEWKQYRIRCKRLDDFQPELSGESISLMKIDVEGHEVEVIKGALEILNRNKPKLYIEISSYANYKAIRSLLSENYHIINYSEPITAGSFPVDLCFEFLKS